MRCREKNTEIFTGLPEELGLNIPVIDAVAVHRRADILDETITLVDVA